MEVHLENLQLMFDNCDFDLILKVMVSILFVMELVSAQYLENNWPILTQLGMEVHLDNHSDEVQLP